MVRRVLMPSGYKDEAARGQRMGIELGNGDGKPLGMDPLPLPLPEAGFEPASFLRFRWSPEG
jgi:hypothetical protein